MKLINERYPIIALKINRFLTFDCPNIGCPFLFNHMYEDTKIIVHLANAVSNKGID